MGHKFKYQLNDIFLKLIVYSFINYVLQNDYEC